MNRTLKCIALIYLSAAAFAQDGPRGHWSGSVEIPDRSLGMEVDLDKTASGWVGEVSVPTQGSSGIPLEAITFADGKVSFRIKGVPGEPTFKGTLSADGKTMSGDFTQGPGSFPFKFSRTGNPKIEPAKKSPAVSKDLVGAWEGTLEAGQSLRLVLKLTNDADGAKGLLISLDQNGVEIPVSAIEQNGSKLKLEVKMVGGGYDAELNKEGSELTGTWTQAGNSLPLKMKKAAKP